MQQFTYFEKRKRFFNNFGNRTQQFLTRFKLLKTKGTFFLILDIGDNFFYQFSN